MCQSIQLLSLCFLIFDLEIIVLAQIICILVFINLTNTALLIIVFILILYGFDDGFIKNMDFFAN